MNATTATAEIATVVCMGCGEPFETIAASMDHNHMKSEITMEAKLPEFDAEFDAILDAEFETQGDKAGVAFRMAGEPLFVSARKRSNWKRSQASLYAMVDALSPERMRAYGAYRAQVIAYYKATR